MKISTSLALVKLVIIKPDTWIKFYAHREINGEDCYDIIGAVNLVMSIEGLPFVNSMIMKKAILDATGFKSTGVNATFTLSRWNDYYLRTHAEVMQTLDLAIAKCKLTEV